MHILSKRSNTLLALPNAIHFARTRKGYDSPRYTHGLPIADQLSFFNFKYAKVDNSRRAPEESEGEYVHNGKGDKDMASLLVAAR